VPKRSASQLDEYRRKRDFSKTPEPPPGGPDAEEKNLVFVVQQHAATNMHWDFRLEVDGVLKSWPLPKGPSLNPKIKRMAVMTEDHPYDYRTFEGVIPKGEYGGGQVIVWDEGIYTPDEDGETSWNDKDEGSRRMLEGIERGKLSFTLRGHKLKGSFALVKTKYAPNSWLMLKHKDEHVTEQDILEQDASVRSGLTIKDLKEGRLPNVATESLESVPNARLAAIPDGRKLRPMLATLGDKPFDAPGWLWEPKLDGIRILAFVKDGKIELRSRRGVDVTKQYPTLCDALKSQPVRSMVLDGEVCALDEAGVPRFQLLQPRINLTKGVDPRRIDAEIPVVYFGFDLLYLDGYDLKDVPLHERKSLMERRLITDGAIRLISTFEGDGRDVQEGAEALGFEGIVGKRADSRYAPGERARTWIKFKGVKEQDFVVGGFTPGEGARKPTFGALAIGYYDGGGVLHYAGNVGSGFDDGELKAMHERLQDRVAKQSPFDAKVPDLTPVRPEIVVQVKYAEWTKDDRLRAPVFVGLRTDIDPADVHREAPVDIDAVEEVTEPAVTVSTPRNTPVAEPPSTLGRDIESVLAQLENSKQTFGIEVGGEQIKLTNLSKEFWPAHGDSPPLTKRDLIEYYVKLAPTLLPHLKDRPLTLTRYPNGVMAKPFYQKHYEQPIPGFVETVDIWSSSNDEDGEYILCNNLATLVWLAQLADLELHAWMARVDPEPDAHGRTTTFSGSEETLEASALNYPDYMVFDLDPYIYSGKEAKGEEPEYNTRGWEKTVETALNLKALLDQQKLSSYIKTSGKTGLHVYLPILRHYDYDDVRLITTTIGRFMVQESPNDITLEWDTSKRKGMVFFDANQNTRGKTLAAQYSLRPTAWAGVSTPIAWSELEGLDPTTLNIHTVPDRIARLGDLWADILAHKSDLSAML
jgi:bifunctional non-homologous end joining protein LigD